MSKVGVHAAKLFASTLPAFRGIAEAERALYGQRDELVRAKLRRDAGASIEAVSSFLDHSSLAVTSIYLRRLEGETDTGWADVASTIGV